MQSRHINEVFVICSALKRSEPGPSGPDHGWFVGIYSFCTSDNCVWLENSINVVFFFFFIVVRHYFSYFIMLGTLCAST